VEQKLQKIFDLFAFGEPMITQVIPLAGKIPFLLGRKVPVYEGLALKHC
jgi:hypothetical protein